MKVLLILSMPTPDMFSRNFQIGMSSFIVIGIRLHRKITFIGGGIVLLSASKGGQNPDYCADIVLDLGIALLGPRAAVSPEVLLDLA
jgi:hypothetical protein